MKKIVFLSYLLITVIITYPLIFHLSTYVFGKGDELLITWILNWDIHALLTNPFNIFDANIFYPYAHTLSFSEPFFTSAILALIPTMILKNPLVAFNINVILSLTLLGFSTYCLVEYLTKNRVSSFVAGILISFSPFTLGRLFQLQVISIQWIPLSILFFLKFLKDGKIRNLIFTSIFFLLQIGSSFLPGYFLIVCYGAILFFYFFSKRNSLKKLLSKNAIIIVTITAFLTILLGIPYFQTSKKFRYVRDIRDTIHFANRPEYAFYPNGRTRLEKFILKTLYSHDKGPYRYDGYWGFAFIILFVLSCISFFKLKRARKFFPVIFLLIAITSFVLSLGPVFQWGGKVVKKPFMIPLPYAIFYYLVPGFSGIRNSGRWEMLTIFSSSVFIGLLLRQILKKKMLLISGIIILVILAEIKFPFKYVQVPNRNNFPKVYSFVNTLPKDIAIIELPIFSWDAQQFSNVEFMREYFSTSHFRKMVNGYSGFSPKEWEQNTKFLTKEFPSKETINYLKNIKIQYIILHKKDYEQLPGFSFESMSKRVGTFPELQFIRQIENDYVYKLQW